jgi:galactose mutarotase-like enzyme
LIGKRLLFYVSGRYLCLSINIMVHLENEILKARINPLGAELVSLINKQTGIDYMWKGDPAFWGKHSPVLFPIVGTLKKNSYHFAGKEYHLPRHGFAREKVFAVTEDGSCFTITSDDTTKSIFPFSFSLDLRYALQDNSLKLTYQVRNTGDDEMYFSLGAHPAFAVPVSGLYQGHYLEFEKPENADRWPITVDGLIASGSEPFLQDQTHLPLHKSLFERDAIVLKGLKSQRISIKSSHHKHGLDFHFEGFPFFGIWAAKDADFVCLEPWCGIADSETHNQDLTQKEGIIKLSAGDSFSRSWSVTVY